ncbi:hypothetical protein [Dactylosporangium sp. CS-033363]|uniref:hypothetical protein n=1 Tax=Dactylosporangium sp. CS-033363 TaxID=3239935 RepID=UPI003D8D46E2
MVTRRLRRWVATGLWVVAAAALVAGAALPRMGLIAAGDLLVVVAALCEPGGTNPPRDAS